MKMYNEMTAIAAVLVLAGGAFSGEHPTAKAKAAAGTGALDGAVFVGEIGKAGEQTGDKDTLVFTAGTFTSTACVEHGFLAAPYKAVEKDGTISFTAMPINEAKETMSWSGVVENGEVKATAVLQAESGQTEYWLKGTLKTKGSKPSDHPRKSEHPKSEHPK